MSVENLFKYNNGYKFILIVIDIFSRFLLVKPLLNKKATTVLTDIKDILKKRRFKKIRSDKGSEFVNSDFKNFMKKNGVYFFTTHNISKANYAERVIRTLRSMMFRFMRQKRDYRYIDHLQDFVRSYDQSPHRSLNGLSPSAINKNNEIEVW